MKTQQKQVCSRNKQRHLSKTWQASVFKVISPTFYLDLWFKLRCRYSWTLSAINQICDYSIEDHIFHTPHMLLVIFFGSVDQPRSQALFIFFCRYSFCSPDLIVKLSKIYFSCITVFFFYFTLKVVKVMFLLYF